jgi:nucleoside-diphosphate-sugar epimerase
MTLERHQFIQRDLEILFSQIDANELSSLRQSTICITGGAGFFGCWLAEVILFLNQNYNFQTKIIIYDRDIESLKLKAPHIVSSPDVVLQRSDVKYLVELPKDVHYIVHAAGQPSSRDHVSHPVETMSGIAIGIESVL